MRRSLVTVLVLAMLGIATIASPARGQDVAAPVITVQDAGDRPRAELRYVLAEGASQQSRLIVNTRITQEVDGDERSGESPEIEIDVTSAVGVPTQDSLVVTSTIDDVSVGEGQGANQIEDAAEPLIGFTVTVEMTNRGEVLSAEGDIPADFDETASQLLEQFIQQARSFTVAFPEEPVGDGARWTARTESTISGIQLRQTARYEVTSLTDEGVELSVKITQRAPRQTFDDPASGIEVELVSSKGSGDGVTTIAFDQPLPTEAETEVFVRQKLRAQGDSISQTVDLNARIEAI
jgi:hypothetical protein